MSSREQRIAANEARFRDVNERIVRNEAPSAEAFEIICECGNAECLERIAVTRADYGRARSDPALFLAKTGHIKAEAEDVVADQPGYQLIRKTGDAASLAEEHDPRS
jgi:hypothetical protein